MKKIDLQLLENNFDNSFPVIKKSKILLPYQTYKNKHKKDGHNHFILDLLHKNPKESIPFEKEVVINKILSDCANLYQSLLLLQKVNIYFSLSIAGGAIRDLLLGNHHQIKDLDIVLQIDCRTIPNYKELKQLFNFDVFQFPWFASPNYNYDNYYMSNEHKIYELVKFILSKEHTFEASYPPNKKISNDKEEHSEYVDRHLKGVLKINSTHLNYPIDLLFSNIKVNEFIKSFDFNICKTAIGVIDMEKSRKKQFHFPKNAQEVLDQFIPIDTFIHDAMNKKITMDMDMRSVHDIQNSIEKHLPRIVAKYPQFPVIFPLDETTTTLYQEKQAIVRHHHLNKLLDSHNENNKTQPNELHKSSGKRNKI